MQWKARKPREEKRQQGSESSNEGRIAREGVHTNTSNTSRGGSRQGRETSKGGQRTVALTRKKEYKPKKKLPATFPWRGNRPWKKSYDTREVNRQVRERDKGVEGGEIGQGTIAFTTMITYHKIQKLQQLFHGGEGDHGAKAMIPGR